MPPGLWCLGLRSTFTKHLVDYILACVCPVSCTWLTSIEYLSQILAWKFHEYNCWERYVVENLPWRIVCQKCSTVRITCSYSPRCIPLVHLSSQTRTERSVRNLQMFMGFIQPRPGFLPPFSAGRHHLWNIPDTWYCLIILLDKSCISKQCG